MAVGTKDLLNLSVLQRSEMSLSLQLLLCPARMLWRGCLLLSKTEYNFLLIFSKGLAFCLQQNQPFSLVCPGAYSFCL